jgi:hypothetical protein
MGILNLAEAAAHMPLDRQEALLQGFAERVRLQWREVFAPYLSAEDVDGMVADVLARVRAKRNRLEGFGGGSA